MTSPAMAGAGLDPKRSGPDLLIQRARLGVGIVSVSVLTFTGADFVSGREANPWLRLVQLIQLVILGSTIVALPKLTPSSVERTVRLFAMAIYLTTGGAGVITGDTLTMELLFLVMAMGSAALLPWTVRSQRESVIFATIVAFAALAWTRESITAAHAYPVLAMLVTFVASVYICRDVSRYRNALEDRNRALARAQELANVGDWEWDVAGNVVRSSEQLRRIYGLDASGIGATYEAFVQAVHPEDREVFRGALRRALQTGDPFQFDYRIIRRDGSVRTVHSDGQVILDGGRRAVCLFGTAQDVTERKRIEEELSRARDAALEAAATKSAFLAQMSHEIRTPLNVLIGYNEIIRETLAERGDRDLQEFQERMQRACRRLLDTIHGILDLSRLEAGSLGLRREPLHLATVVGRVVEDFRPLAKAKDLALSLEMAEPEAIVWFDEYCLSGALLNLLQNAIKFTERGEVAVKVSRDPAGVLYVEVRDTGIGIDQGFLPNLFDPFRQEESGYRRRFEGAGLGLALAKRYLESNGARISVESAKGRGSTFRVEFPRACEQAPEANIEAGAPAKRARA